MSSRIFLVFGAVLSLSVAGAICAAEPVKKPSDAELAKRIVGKWLEKMQLPGGGSDTGTTTYKKDGTLTGEGTVTRRGRTVKVTFSGTWKVADGALVETVEKCDPPMIPKGKMFKDHILSVTDKVLKVKTKQGKEVTKMRVSD